MNNLFATQIAAELQVSLQQVTGTLDLLEEGATVPFIARYRKETTGSLDEVVIAQIRDRKAELSELETRREYILNVIREQGKLTPELEKLIRKAGVMNDLEDLYLPYKPKRRTRAMIAREKGLEPLSEWLDQQGPGDPEREAMKFVSAEKGVKSVEEALAGARDIIAEKVNESAAAREKIRGLFQRKGMLKSKLVKGKEEEGAKYRDYFAWDESAKNAPSHRLLAMFRGEEEKILSLSIAPPEEDAIFLLNRTFVKGNTPRSAQVAEAVEDSYKRLMSASLENEMRATLKQKADAEAIKVFAENLRQLLLAPPLGQKVTLAIDPGFRTGCKVVVLDKQGKLLHNENIYPHPPQQHGAQARGILQKLITQFKVEAIAIGNGTAGRETEDFVREMNLPAGIQIVQVNESGASIYSASEAAREEFPDQDITVRGSISIGRRLMDPLAELVKLDPKSIGVGQYQHDVDQGALQKSLDDVVVSCVNHVGVEINTASKQLLMYVSGLGPQLAQNIVEYRNEKGAFKSRTELKKVARLGEKAFEQCAGFLRISDAKHPLDRSAVHPERYALVERMAKDQQCSISDLMEREDLRKKIRLADYTDARTGLPTLQDILTELAKPGRDPRESFQAFQFAEGVHKISDLKEGMVLPGIVTNVTRFGAFVDIGVHQDGLVHVSAMADRYIKDPSEVVKVQQKVRVKVVEVDEKRKRIGLSMKGVG